MEYIKLIPKTVYTLSCDHPKVEMIWEYGGLAANPTNSQIQRFVCLQMKDGTKQEFKDNGGGTAVKEAEKYLQSVGE